MIAPVGADDHIGPLDTVFFLRADVVIGPYK
jgi:hypothetical protein